MTTADREKSALRHERKSPVSRRGFLRGASLALALPWIETLPLRGAESGKIEIPGDPPKAPVRFACVYFSNGV